jgi:predicted nucleic acid-binding Zn ribbon protein
MIELSLLLPKALRQLPLSDELLENWVFSVWRQAVGEPLHQKTKPFRVYKSTLIVSVPSTTWKRQLHSLQGEILQKIHQVMGQKTIRALEFRVNSDLGCDTSPTLATDVPESREPIKLPLESIQDTELRRSFAAAASSYLNRLR